MGSWTSAHNRTDGVKRSRLGSPSGYGVVPCFDAQGRMIASHRPNTPCSAPQSTDSATPEAPGHNSLFLSPNTQQACNSLVLCCCSIPTTTTATLHHLHTQHGRPATPACPGDASDTVTQGRPGAVGGSRGALRTLETCCLAPTTTSSTLSADPTNALVCSGWLLLL